MKTPILISAAIILLSSWSTPTSETVTMDSAVSDTLAVDSIVNEDPSSDVLVAE